MPFLVEPKAIYLSTCEFILMHDPIRNLKLNKLELLYTPTMCKCDHLCTSSCQTFLYDLFFESNCSTVCGVHDCVHEIKEKRKKSYSSEHQGEEAICKLFM
jgi:hypothetical protein